MVSSVKCGTACWRDCPRRAAGLPGRSGGRLAGAGQAVRGRTRRVVGRHPFGDLSPHRTRRRDMKGATCAASRRLMKPASRCWQGPGSRYAAHGGRLNIVLGQEPGAAARRAGGRYKVTLVAPGGQVTPAGVTPRLRAFTVGASSAPGTTSMTAAWRSSTIDDAAKPSVPAGPRACSLLADVHQARDVARQLSMSPARRVQVRD